MHTHLRRAHINDTHWNPPINLIPRFPDSLIPCFPHPRLLYHTVPPPSTMASALARCNAFRTLSRGPSIGASSESSPHPQTPTTRLCEWDQGRACALSTRSRRTQMWRPLAQGSTSSICLKCYQFGVPISIKGVNSLLNTNNNWYSNMLIIKEISPMFQVTTTNWSWYLYLL